MTTIEVIPAIVEAVWPRRLSFLNAAGTAHSLLFAAQTVQPALYAGLLFCSTAHSSVFFSAAVVQDNQIPGGK